MDGVQLYSLLLLISKTNNLRLPWQHLFICLTWTAPIVTYSPLLWWPEPTDKMDYLPYRRFVLGVPRWILFTIYISMYIVPMGFSLILTSMTIGWTWINQCYRTRSMTVTQHATNEHQETMAELTSLVETVLSFELNPSTTARISNVSYCSR
jgi:hypothetical protein